VLDRTVVSLGGHLLGALDPPSTPEETFHKAAIVARALSPLLASKSGLLVVHGNGPQVGIELLRSEMARPRVPPSRLDLCVAQTQGSMGYVLASALREEVRKRGLELPVVSVGTSVVVEGRSGSLKPIGPLLTPQEARVFERERGWRVVRDEHGLRRAVLSPRPVGVVEIDSIRLLLEAGHIVIAGGGGGVPLVRDREGGLGGVDGVVDKDRTAALLAIGLGRSRMVHLTSVDAIYRSYGTPQAAPIARLSAEEAHRLFHEGQFLEGSMAPKIEASLQFLRSGGETVLVTSPECLADALAERAGTWIVP
jgi:carbamate kinase